MQVAAVSVWWPNEAHRQPVFGATAALIKSCLMVLVHSNSYAQVSASKVCDSLDRRPREEADQSGGVGSRLEQRRRRRRRRRVQDAIGQDGQSGGRGKQRAC